MQTPSPTHSHAYGPAGSNAAKAALAFLILAADAGTAQQSNSASQSDHPRTGGHPPGGAFVFRPEEGFDDDLYRISDYEISQPWIEAGFSPDNAIFEGDQLLLSLSSNRYGSREYTGAEFQRKGFYGYGRYEVVMKGVGGDGLVSSFFTHTHGQFGDPHDEIDIELLGRNTRQVHLNYFRDGESGAAVNIDLPFDFAAAFHLYAFEWAPDSIKWFVDGRQIHEATVNIPVASGRVIAQAWVGGEGAWEWTGTPDAVHGAAAIRCFSHVPAGQTAPQCSDMRPVSGEGGNSHSLDRSSGAND